jgi:2-dehydropantoate 2-reductase
MMEEAAAIGAAIGVHSALTVDAMIASARTFGPVKTSMLQDLERGTPVEIDALLTVTATSRHGERADALHRQCARPRTPARRRARADRPGGLKSKRPALACRPSRLAAMISKDQRE